MSPSWPPVRYETSKLLTFTRCRVKIAPSAAPIDPPAASCVQRLKVTLSHATRASRTDGPLVEVLAVRLSR